MRTLPKRRVCLRLVLRRGVSYERSDEFRADKTDRGRSRQIGGYSEIRQALRRCGVAGFDVYTVRQPSGGEKIKYGVLSDKRKYIVAKKGIYYIEK